LSSRDGLAIHFLETETSTIFGCDETKTETETLGNRDETPRQHDGWIRNPLETETLMLNYNRSSVVYHSL